MLEKINLFPKTQAIWEQRVKARRLIYVGSIVALILYFVLLSSVLSYSLLLNSQAKSLVEKIANLEEKVKRLQTVESKQFFLKSKLKILASVLKKEDEPKEVLASWQFLAVPGISLEKINFREGVATLQGRADDAVVFDNFIKNFEVKGISYFSQAQVENVTRSPEGDYNFELLLVR